MKVGSSFAGLNGFVWFLGVVENRNDPLKAGRCQIRIFGWHTDNLQLIPTADLPWCQPIQSLNTWDISKVPHDGEWVVGFFLDGESGQIPLYFGTIPAIPHVAADQSKGFSDQRTAAQIAVSPNASLYPMNLDEPTTSRLFRNENIDQTIVSKVNDSLKTGIEIAGGGSWDQPTSSYAAVHPFNEVKETESGHIMEFDDTKGAERINLYHKSGTYTEIRPDGSQVISVKANKFTITVQDDNIYIGGKYNVSADGDMNLKSGGILNLQIASDSIIKIDGDLTATIGGDVTASISGSVTASASGFDLTGPTNIIGDTTITGTLAIIGAVAATGIVSSDIDVSIAGKSFNEHTHGGVEGGSDETDPPS